mmetsp:Transcript_277/g.1020  ORF Transcript_277/g.1020 Transcript_277/m.1020 type:complete len:335 (+) Transcript_277:722-1726(+)
MVWVVALLRVVEEVVVEVLFFVGDVEDDAGDEEVLALDLHGDVRWDLGVGEDEEEDLDAEEDVLEEREEEEALEDGEVFEGLAGVGDEDGVGDGGEGRLEGEDGLPGADVLGLGRDGSAGVLAELPAVEAELDEVVRAGEEGAEGERRKEEGRVAELGDGLGVLVEGFPEDRVARRPEELLLDVRHLPPPGRRRVRGVLVLAAVLLPPARTWRSQKEELQQPRGAPPPRRRRRRIDVGLPDLAYLAERGYDDFEQVADDDLEDEDRREELGEVDEAGVVDAVEAAISEDRGGDVALEGGDVEEGSVGDDEAEDEGLGDEVVLVLGLRPVVLDFV